MLEALACESRKTVLPAYYEIALKARYTRDSQSVKILDMIMDNRRSDFADTIFRDQVDDGFVLQVMRNKKMVQVSDIVANQKKVEAAIQSAIKILQEE